MNKLFILPIALALLVSALDVRAQIAPLGPQPVPEPIACRALDAVGNTIPKALIQSWPQGGDEGPVTESSLTTTDGQGNFALPPKFATVTLVRLLHPDYGIAEVQLYWPIGNSACFPLVRKGSEAEKSALHGSVLDSANKPVAGARVRISDSISPDGAFFHGKFVHSSVFTDKAGRFTIYPLPDPNRPVEAAPGFSYFLAVLSEPSHELFPYGGRYKASEEIVIHLERPQLVHRLAVTGPDGQQLTPEQITKQYVSLSYVDKNNRSLPVPAVFNKPTKLLPGAYVAIRWADDEGRPSYMESPPIEVTERSPEELEFVFRRR